jgi:hypothetical protein
MQRSRDDLKLAQWRLDCKISLSRISPHATFQKDGRSSHPSCRTTRPTLRNTGSPGPVVRNRCARSRRPSLIHSSVTNTGVPAVECTNTASKPSMGKQENNKKAARNLSTIQSPDCADKRILCSLQNLIDSTKLSSHFPRNKCCAPSE